MARTTRVILSARKKRDDFLSIRIVRLIMKTVGFWIAESKVEERALNGILGYMLFATIYAIWAEATELYFSMGDFYKITYTACSVMPVVINLVKLSVFVAKRKEMLKMLKYTQDNFWYAQYDEYGSKLMDDINKKGTVLICMFTFFVETTAVTYAISPIIENIGKNESDRILPFNIWMGFPLNESPNFEIVFVIEILALFHTSLCFCCFDNLLSLLNLHTAGQFKLLQHRLETILERVERMQSGKVRIEQAVYEEIRGCISQHHELIWYSKKMEGIFMYTTLSQLLVSSVMVCVAGFQVFLAQGIFIRRLIFIAHTNGSFWQLFVITLTAHNLMDESRAVGDAAYKSNWHVLSHRSNRNIRNAVLMIVMRSSRPCSISAGGFFPVSLETLMAVLSTAASYFTLLRNFIVE